MDEQKKYPKKVPDEIEARLNAWYRMFNFASRTHYVVGVLGVACSALAASNVVDASQILAAISAVCIAILGFAQPEKKYLKFVRAWRVLDAAVLKYKYGKIDLDALLEKLERGEQLITEVEYDELRKPSKVIETKP